MRKMDKIARLKRTMKSFVDAYEGGCDYTFRNEKLHPKLKQKLDSIIRQVNGLTPT